MGFVKSEKGSSIIWALILLVVVGILTATLLAASTHNIRFGVSETDRSRAFYAAEAGVEHTIAEATNSPDEFRNILENNGSGSIIIESNNEFDDQIVYDVEFIGDFASEDFVFLSKGRVNDEVERIEFKLNVGPGEGETDIMTLLYAFADNTTLYKAHTDYAEYVNPEGEGQNKEYEPGKGNDWEDIWEEVKVNFTYDDIEDIEDLDNVQQISIWNSRYSEYEEGDYVIHNVDPSGQEGEYSFDNMSLFELMSAAEDSDYYDFDEGDWGEFYYHFVRLIEEEENDDSDFEFIEYDDYKDNRSTFTEEDLDAFSVVEEGAKLRGENDHIVDENIIYSPYLDLLGDPDVYYEKDWDEDTDFGNNDIAEYEGDFYEATTGNPVHPGEDAWEDDWEIVSDPSDWGNITIESSIVIVDGSLEMSNVTLIDSIVIVRDQIDFDGVQTFDNSMLMGFNDAGGDDVHAISGLPSVNIDGLLTEDTFKDWPIIRDVIRKIEERSGNGESNILAELDYWRER